MRFKRAVKLGLDFFFWALIFYGVFYLKVKFEAWLDFKAPMLCDYYFLHGYGNISREIPRVINGNFTNPSFLSSKFG